MNSPENRSSTNLDASPRDLNLPFDRSGNTAGVNSENNTVTIRQLKAEEVEILRNAVSAYRTFCDEVLPAPVKFVQAPSKLNTPADCVREVKSIHQHFSSIVELLKLSNPNDTPFLNSLRSELSSMNDFIARLQPGIRSDGMEVSGHSSAFQQLQAIDQVARSLRLITVEIKAVFYSSTLVEESSVQALRSQSAVIKHGGELVGRQMRDYASRTQGIEFVPTPKDFKASLLSNLKSNPLYKAAVSLTAVTATFAGLGILHLATGITLPNIIALPLGSFMATIASGLAYRTLRDYLIKRKSDQVSYEEIKYYSGGSFRSRDPHFTKKMPVQSISVIISSDGKTAPFSETLLRLKKSGASIDNFSSLSFIQVPESQDLKQDESELTLTIDKHDGDLPRPLDRRITAVEFIDKNGNRLQNESPVAIREFAAGGFQIESKIPVEAEQIRFRWTPGEPVKISEQGKQILESQLHHTPVTTINRNIRYGAQFLALECPIEEKANSVVGKFRERKLYYSKEPLINWLLDHSGDLYFDVLAVLATGNCNTLTKLAASEIGAFSPTFIVTGIVPRIDNTSEGKANGHFTFNPLHAQAIFQGSESLVAVDLTTHVEQLRPNQDVFSKAEIIEIQELFICASPTRKLQIADHIRNLLVQRTNEGQGKPPEQIHADDAGHSFQDSTRRIRAAEVNAGKTLSFAHELIFRLNNLPIPQNLGAAVEYYATHKFTPLSQDETKQLSEHLSLTADFNPALLILDRFRSALVQENLTEDSRISILKLLKDAAIPTSIKEARFQSPEYFTWERPAIFSPIEVAKILDSSCCARLSFDTLIDFFKLLDRSLCSKEQTFSRRTRGDTSTTQLADDLQLMTRAFINITNELLKNPPTLEISEDESCIQDTIQDRTFHIISVLGDAECKIGSQLFEQKLEAEFRQLWSVIQRSSQSLSITKITQNIVEYLLAELPSETNHRISNAVALASRLGIRSTFSDLTELTKLGEIINDHLFGPLLYCLENHILPELFFEELEKLGFDIRLTPEITTEVVEFIGTRLKTELSKDQVLDLPSNNRPATNIFYSISNHPCAVAYRFTTSLARYDSTALTKLLALWPESHLDEAATLITLTDSCALDAEGETNDGPLSLLVVSKFGTTHGQINLLEVPSLIEELLADRPTFLCMQALSGNISGSAMTDKSLAAIKSQEPEMFSKIVFKINLSLQFMTRLSYQGFSRLKLELIESLATSMNVEDLYCSLLWVAHHRVRTYPVSEEGIQQLEAIKERVASQQTRGSINEEIIEEVLGNNINTEAFSFEILPGFENHLRTMLRGLSDQDSDESQETGEIQTLRQDIESKFRNIIIKVSTLDSCTDNFDEAILLVIESELGKETKTPEYFKSLTPRAKLAAILIQSLIWEESKGEVPIDLIAKKTGLPTELVNVIMGEHFLNPSEISNLSEFFWNKIVGKSIEDNRSPAQRALVKGIPRLIGELQTTQRKRRASSNEDLKASRNRKSLSGSYDQFAEHREYTVGDPLKHVDWKRFGKSDRMYVKTFNEPLSEKTVFICDLAYLTEGVENWKGGKLTPKSFAAAQKLSRFLELLHQEEVSGRSPHIIVGGRDGVLIDLPYKELIIESGGRGALYAEDFLLRLVQNVEHEGRLRTFEKQFLSNLGFNTAPLSGAKLPRVRPGTRIITGISPGGFISSRSFLKELEHKSRNTIELI